VYDLLVLGPGPGHPKDYSLIFQSIQDALIAQKKILGICLGHQLIWYLKGFEISKSQKPMHGQKFQVNLSEDWQRWLNREKIIWVQRYNSLSVKMNDLPFNVFGIIMEGELIMSRFGTVITYQFHPESLGTKCRQSFFRPIFQDNL
jgi:anthranilate/para-aminobenzoate synthase component II